MFVNRKSCAWRLTRNKGWVQRKGHTRKTNSCTSFCWFHRVKTDSFSNVGICIGHRPALPRRKVHVLETQGLSPKLLLINLQYPRFMSSQEAFPMLRAHTTDGKGLELLQTFIPTFLVLASSGELWKSWTKADVECVSRRPHTQLLIQELLLIVLIVGELVKGKFGCPVKCSGL